MFHTRSCRIPMSVERFPQDGFQRGMKFKKVRVHIITLRSLSATSSERPKSVWQILATKDRTSQAYGTRAGTVISWVPPPRSSKRADKCLHQAEVGTQCLHGSLKDHRRPQSHSAKASFLSTECWQRGIVSSLYPRRLSSNSKALEPRQKAPNTQL